MTLLIKLKEKALKGLSFLFSDKLADTMTRIFSRRLVEQIRGAATDDFLELLLGGMALALSLSRSYRRNIRGFSATYVFATSDGAVGATARFDGHSMHVDKTAANDWTVRVLFKDAKALRRFLFGKNQDILDSILRNEVEVFGNVNYVYKLGFLARDLERRAGLLPSA